MRSEKLLHALPNWSGLRTLGQSRVVSLTALVPFLGTLILFNQQIVDLLLVSPDIVENWLGTSGHTSIESSRDFTASRLVITYFGLVAIGLASFLFSLLCPQEIKRSASALLYIETEKPLATPARTTIMVTQAVQDYLRNHGTEGGYGDEPANGPRILRDLAYPVSLQFLFEEVIRHISQRSLEGVDADIYSGNGNIHIEKVARILSAQRRGERHLWMPFHAEAEDYHTDLLALIFEARDHSRPTARAAISILYGAGFLTLLYPTASTLFLIIKRTL